jgi:hypothetical protein
MNKNYISYFESSDAEETTPKQVDSALSKNSADPILRLPINPRQLMKHKAKKIQSNALHI